MLLKLLKFVGFGLVALLLVVAVYFYNQVYNYPQYELKVDVLKSDSSEITGISSQADIDELAKNLIGKMTLTEKIQQLYGEKKHNLSKLVGNILLFDRFPHFYIGRNERLGIPPFVLSDGPRGARLADSYGGATTFPVAMSRGASWDTDLEARINDVIAKEIRASGANMAATPCINLLRHPGWVAAVYDAVESINAGLNVEMPVQFVYTDEAIEAGLDNSQISEAQIDQLIYQSLRVRLKYALAPDSMDYTRSLLAQPQHRQLALEAAEQGMVLLKNDGVLPFAKTAGKTIVLIGQLGDIENTGDKGSSNSKSPYVVTPYEGLQAYHERLGNTVIFDDGSDLKRAVALAKSADDVVVVVGYTFEDEGEYIIPQGQWPSRRKRVS